MVRDAIDVKTVQDLNNDGHNLDAAERAVSEKAIGELKQLYSPEKEGVGEALANKKAVINAIVDIAAQPQKLSAPDSNIQLLGGASNFSGVDIASLFGRSSSGNRLDSSSFTITPQEIADAIYGEGVIDMIEELELALDYHEGGTKKMTYTKVHESLSWRMDNGKLKSFELTEEGGKFVVSILPDYSSYGRGDAMQTIHSLPIKIKCDSREEAIETIQGILREENKRFSVTDIVGDPTVVGGDEDGPNMGPVTVGDIEAFFSGEEALAKDFDFSKLLDAIPNWEVSELKRLLLLVYNTHKLGFEDRKDIISAIFKTDKIEEILSGLSNENLVQIYAIEDGDKEKIVQEILKRGLIKFTTEELLRIQRMYIESHTDMESAFKGLLQEEKQELYNYYKDNFDGTFDEDKYGEPFKKSIGLDL